MTNQKGFIQISLLILIIGGLFLIAQPTQAGFLDWFSLSKIKSFFSGESVEEKLPASVAEPTREISAPQETPQEIPEEIQPEVILEFPSEVTKEIIKEIPVEKIIYKNNPKQEATIQNLRNQIASLQNQIKTLEKQIKNLLSKSPEIKVITKEVPVEKIVIKEVPVEKIVYVDRQVVQECEECPICPEVTSELEVSDYFLTIERIGLSSDFLSSIHLENKNNLSMFNVYRNKALCLGICAYHF